MSVTSRRGRLLIASPTLVDPNFSRRVVLVLEHGADGALGLVLGEPTDLRARDALPPPLGELFDEEERIHCGGPVEESAVIVLVEAHGRPEIGAGVFGSVYILDPEGDGPATLDAVAAARAFSGYAGWSAGQLEAEIAEGAWIDGEPTVGDVFETSPSLWRRALERKGGAYRVIATMPADPSLN